MEDKPYRLDRSKLITHTFSEANDHVTYWNDKSEDERLNAACFIINQIYGVTPQTKVIREITDRRKHS